MSALDQEKRTTVFVVHPDDAARAALVEQLRADDEIAVVDDRPTAAVDDVLLLMPDVLAVAAGHPDLDGPALVHDTHVNAPVITVVALLADGDDGYGALSCIAADEPEPDVAVKAAWRGEAAISRSQAQEMLSDFDRVSAHFDDVEHAPTLTPTEREVLERLAKGERPTDIADEYEVTDRLVNLHAGYAVGKVHWALDAERRLAALPAD